MHYCQSWKQSLWFWMLLIKEYLFLPHFLFSSHIPLTWSYKHIWSHQISLLALVVLSCFISSFSPLCALAVSPLLLMWLFLLPAWAHIFSPILNVQTYKTPFSHICLSNYSHHVSIMKAQMHLLCGVSLSTVDLLNPLPRFLVFTTCRNERTSSSQSVVL